MQELVLEFPCRLPPDPRGVPHGAAYLPFKNYLTDGGFATGSGFRGIKAGRTHSALGALAREFIELQELDPSVLDIREEYPAYDEAWVRERLTAGTRIGKTDLMCLDVVLTKIHPSSPGSVLYQACFLRPEDQFGDEADARRVERERAFCSKWKFEWKFVDQRYFEAANTRAAAHVVDILRGLRDIESSKDRAHEAGSILRRRPFETLRHALTAIARGLRVDRQRARELFAVAVAYGYVELSPEHPLEESKPLRILGGNHERPC